MTVPSPTPLITITLAFILVTLPQHALATLGEPADSIAADLRALGATQKATTVRANYTVQEVASPSATVREYANLSGTIFAVAWKGLMHPNLTPLLGRYFPEYQEASQRAARVPGQRRMQVKGDRVVVERWGHMRALQGRAYLPALLPPGVTVDEIQ